MPTKHSFKTHEEYLQWYRDYRKKNHLKFRLYQRNYNRKWRAKNGYHNEEKWKKNNPDKLKAQKLAQYAKRIGVLVPKPCEVCGFEKTDMHHKDYTKPLKVKWLCKLHHKQYHQRCA